MYHLSKPSGLFGPHKQSDKLTVPLLALLAICFCALAAASDCDLVEDNSIDWADLAEFAAKWLTDCSVFNCGGADFNNDNTVNSKDFALFSGHWLIVPEPHLIGWWKFDEGSGNVAADSSGNDYDGTISGEVWSDGKIGKSLNFNGSNRYVTINSAALLPLNGCKQVTVAFWHYGDLNQPQGTNAFQAVSSNSDRVIAVQLAWYGTVYWDTVKAGSWDRLSKGAQPSEYKGQWNHWVFIKDADAGVMGIYLNGSLWASEAGKYNSLGRAVSFKIGSNINGQENCGGRLDDFRIYNTALGEESIEEIYISAFNKASSPYPLDAEAVWDSQLILNWDPAPRATKHDVYLGTNFDDVNSANTTIYNPNGVYLGQQSGNSHSITSGAPWELNPNTTYYWRIDEVIGSTKYKGDAWSFVYRPDEMFDQWGAETLGQIDRDLKRSGSNLYVEYAQINGSKSQTAYIWPQGIQFHTLNNASIVDPTTYLETVKRFAAELHSSYWSYKNGIWGYDSGISGGTRFYDDNAWLVLAYMRLYELTNGDTLYLERAEDTMAFVMSGENEQPQSGIAWDEGSSGTSVCATAPAIVGNLLLYQATGTQHYLDDATRLYNWITNKSIGIQDAQTGLFHQGCDTNLAVNWGYRGYQTAVPLRACLLFYQILGDESYLVEAQRLASSMEERWVNEDGAFSETGQWGGFDMVEAYVDLYNIDSNSHWLNIVRRALYFLHANCKDPNGRYPEYWDAFQTSEIQEFHLLYQGPVATAYWKAASVME